MRRLTRLGFAGPFVLTLAACEAPKSIGPEATPSLPPSASVPAPTVPAPTAPVLAAPAPTAAASLAAIEVPVPASTTASSDASREGQPATAPSTKAPAQARTNPCEQRYEDRVGPDGKVKRVALPKDPRCNYKGEGGITKTGAYLGY